MVNHRKVALHSNVQQKFILRFVFFVALFISFFPAISFAQPQPKKVYSTNKSAIRDYEDGRKQFNSGQDVKAIRLMESAIAKDPNFIDAWLILGQIYIESRDYASALEHYRKVTEIDPAYMPGANMVAGELELKRGNYAAAKGDFERYLKAVPAMAAELKTDAEQKIKSCDFALEALKNPVPFQPVNLGTDINTP